MLKKISKQELLELVRNYEKKVRPDDYSDFWDDSFLLPVPKESSSIRNYDIKKNSLSILQGKPYKNVSPKIMYCVDPKDYFEVVFIDNNPDDKSGQESIVNEILDYLVIDEGVKLSKEEFYDLFEEIIIPDPIEIRKNKMEMFDNFSEEFLVIENFYNLFKNAEFTTPCSSNFLNYVKVEKNLGDKINIEFSKKDNTKFDVKLELPENIEHLENKNVTIKGTCQNGDDESFESQKLFENEDNYYVEIKRENYLNLVRMEYSKDLTLKIN